MARLVGIERGEDKRAMAGKGEATRVEFYGDFVLRIVAKAEDIARRVG